MLFRSRTEALPKPEFVLYGTLITDDLRLAYIEDLKAPRNSPGRGKRQTALKKGDTLSGFTLNDIEADRIVMARGEEKIVVLVNDPSRSKERKETGLAALPVQPAGTKRGSASVTQPPIGHANPKPVKSEKSERLKRPGQLGRSFGIK